jgi:hypothetical protein
LKSKLILNGETLSVSQKYNEMKWYRFRYDWALETIPIVANPSKGRVQFYISIESSNMHPDANNYNYVSWGVNSASYNLILYQPSWIYIGINSILGDSEYTLQINTYRSYQTMYINNYYLIQNMPFGHYKYYMMVIPRNMTQGMEIFLQQQTGIGSIFVSQRDNSAPTAERYTWRSEESSGKVKAIILSKEDLNHPNSTILYIGVRSENQRERLTSYVRSLFPLDSFPIQNDREIVVPFTAGSKRFYSYFNHIGGRLKFYFQCEQPYCSVQVLIGEIPNPDWSTYLYYLYLSNKESRSFVIDPASFDKTYYLTIYNYGGAAQIKIKVNADYELLRLGSQPIQDSIRKGSSLFYRLWYNDIPRFMVSTTLITGRTEMYLIQGDGIPSPQNFLFSSIDYPGNVFYLQNTTTRYNRALWTIGIYAKEDSDYYISSQSDIGDLELGIPVTGKTMKSDLQYYHTDVNSSQNVFVNGFAAEYTCTRVYISQSEKYPNSLTAKWKTNSNSNFNHQIFFMVPSSELDPRIPHLYFGIEGCDKDLTKWRPYEISVSQMKSKINFNSHFFRWNSFISRIYKSLWR